MVSASAPRASSSNRPMNLSGDQNQVQPTSKVLPTLDLHALQNASRVLQDQLNKDAQIIPELNDMLTIPGVPSSASYSVFPDDFRVPFQKRRLVGIPDALFQYYNTTSVTSHMGLMPEIERVWITIDHNLFLWDYIEGQELSSYVDQPDVITHVALVRPKAGVFIDEITFLLVVCTPVSVLLIGLSVNPATGANSRTHKDIKLYATDMTVSVDVEMTSVIGTQEGRIFMCGVHDGCLYELHYQEKEGWFGKRVHMLNHSVGGVQSLIPRLSAPRPEDRIITVVSDTSRGCFYTLTANNTVSIYKTNGDKSVQHVHTLSNLYKAAQDKAPGSPALTPQKFQIIALHIIDQNESRSGVQLMAITANAVRLYFSPSSGFNQGFMVGGGAQSAIRPLQLTHVRLPPPNLLHPDEQSGPHRPTTTGYSIAQASQQLTSRPYVVSNLENSCYDAGLLVAAEPADVDGTDYVLCISPDLTRVGSLGQVHGAPSQLQLSQFATTSYSMVPGPSRPPLTENAALLAIPGRTWAMALVPRPVDLSTTSVPSNLPVPVITNELAYQISEPTRQFMILTNVGLTFLAKRRALDYLKDVIEEFQVEGNAQPLIEFRDSFGRDQTCAMLLAIAGGNTFLSAGEQASIGSIRTVGPEIAMVAKQAFYDFGERPMWAERVTYGTSEGSGTAIFSGRREGFALYFARLVRPFWKAKLTKTNAAGLHDLNVQDSILIAAQRNLHALKDLLDANPHLFHSIPGDYAAGRSGTSSDLEAWKAEHGSVSQLLDLLARTVEAISFVLLLSDHQLGELIRQCEPAIQQIATSMTFEDLVTDDKGVTASRALVNVVINQHIGQQISVDTISEVLQQRCGSFCSTDDVMLYKARENVRKAVETRNPAERSRNVEFEKLREICGDYQQLNYAKGAIVLPLHCAKVYDADGQGQEYWIAGCPANDSRSSSWERRIHCYELVLDSLSVFEERSAQAKHPSSSGLTIEDPERVRSHAYELAFDNEDEMFHSSLYDWLIKRNMADELLEMRPVYLEAHLRRPPVTVQKFQLLWQFYVKDGQSLRAAEVLGALAESTEFNLSLGTRLEYLTLAIGNAKSHPVSAGGRHETAIAFLTDLEEKLEVAQVQFELYNTLIPRINEPGEIGEKVQLLSTGLMNITELYQEYAEPFDLPIIKLLILHVSEHRDENIARPIWNKIFEDAINGGEPETATDRIISQVVPLGQRFYPSESAFPLRYIASLLVRFGLTRKGAIPYGWAPRALAQCGVPYPEIWDICYEMYESQVPPFNEQANVQAISSDIAVLLTDWIEEAKRPQSAASRGEFPVYRIDQAIDQYLAELEPSRTVTKAAYENLKRQLRRNW
ncbi:uncharacterized protein FIBRA_07408 [Fibroporia radiculosa]|uniref:Nucleoporin Nup133/Nup155-like N-terminal domain-containing protein n=1 Tax=Fibroporia radiculosa TaxID=599839 RepID=J4H4L5_9APHY|nr:uncharacterized protein FIBRA_07408 [Fibroporia radiculosa]CCM05199.1 predicted protein [Fibroporia radiculosa]